VIGVDLRQDRVDRALELGAAAGATLRSGEVDGIVRRESDGHGADAVIVAAATSDNAPIELAARVARDRASVTVVGDVRLELPRRAFYEKELELRVSRSYGPGRYDPAYEEEGHDYPIGYVRWTERRLIAYFFQEVAAGRIRLSELVTHEFPVDQAKDAYEALNSEGRLAILLRYDHEADGSPRTPAVDLPAAVRAREIPGSLGVGLIGPGLFARSTLLPQLAKLKDVELVAIAGRTPARALFAGRRWKARRAAANAEEVIADDAVDVVVVATRHDSHARLVARVLQRDKAVFVEKPLAIDETGLSSVRARLTDDRRLVVGFNRSLAPATAAVRSYFRDTNSPLSLSCRVNAGFLEPSHWLHDPEEGGGRLVGEGCHFVDLCSAIVGSPLRFIQVAPLGNTPASPFGDSFTLVLGYEDGSVATVIYASGGSARMAKERVEVMGDGRSAVIDDFRRVELLGGRAWRRFKRTNRSILPRRDKGHGALLSEAFGFFRDGGEPPIPYRRLVETTKATLLARDALSAGRRGPVPVEE